MKRLFFFLILVGTVTVQAQQQYVTEKDVHYYADSINKNDNYIASQCTLDIYYPNLDKPVPKRRKDK